MDTTNRHLEFRAIYADPPWNFRNYSDKGTGRNPVSHYDCMSLSDMKKLPVAQLAAKDCALFLWVTDPFLPAGLELISAWGFTYKTVAVYWVKANAKADLPRLSERDCFTGLGYWTRANQEQCLLATRGKPHRKAKDVRRLVVDVRREHSRKPDKVRSGIERLVDGPYLELFTRESVPGWSAWGTETGLFDNGPVQTRRQPSNMAR